MSALSENLPALDLQAVMINLNGAKELVSAVLEKLRAEREAAEKH